MKFKILLALTSATLCIGVTGATESKAPRLGDLVNQATQLNVRVIAHAKLGQIAAMRDDLVSYGAEIHVQGKDWLAVTVGVTKNNYQELLALKSILHVEKDQLRFSSPISVKTVSAQELITKRDVKSSLTVVSANSGSLISASGTATFPYRWDGDELVPYGIDAVQASDFSPNATGMPRVCIIDTGYDLGHPDLPSTNVNGITGVAGPWSSDGHGHGTHVAGTIAAKGGNPIDYAWEGVVGVIPFGSKLLINRAGDDSGNLIWSSDLAGAVKDCADAGAKVINLSLGGPLKTEAEEEALEEIAEDDVLIIAAAGNSGNANHSYPASYDSVVSVAAVDFDNQQAYFSQRTAQVELSAPGVDVMSTYPGGWSFMSGTSMATPHVTGVAATVWSHFPDCSAEDIRNALSASALDLGEMGYDYETGFGLVQTQSAYEYLNVEGC